MTEKTVDQEVQLKDSERQPCEVWTRVMGYHRPCSPLTLGRRVNLKNASALLKRAPRLIRILLSNDVCHSH